ncbi:DNA-(apurinic or apyrimidinic site) lyase [Chelonus insularis]|uniref:DNA-(apurinic or apyrimidinic site) lyase n=1 Tax=Chelonus insularis TaxID=460826 RepID=UPI00158AD548|nr:DNA-(apurinic or apyrimidinic site) lyase [Chelonus insularis]
MGNIIVRSKIIPRVKEYKNILSLKLIEQLSRVEQKSVTQPSLSGGFEVFNMPKRGRTAQTNVVEETKSEEEFQKEEKLAKKPRKTAVEKPKSSRKKKIVEEKNDSHEEDNVEAFKLEPKKKETRSKRAPKAKKEKSDSESEVEETNPEPKPPPKTRKTKATKKQVVENTKQQKDPSIEATKNGNESDNEVKKSKSKKSEGKQPINQTGSNLDTVNFNCDKMNAEGKKPNIKISSWNVAGLRAMIKKNGMDYIVKEDADIMVLQETKCDKNKLPKEVKINGYKYYFLDSEKSGYCGMALYTKQEPISITYGVKNSEFDNEGRVITAEYPEFYLVNVYVPNAGQKLVTLPKRLKWNEVFKNYIKKLDEKKPVIVCGDMNVAHKEIDLKNPKTNVKNAGFTKEEREGMDDFLTEGFIDSFRHLYPDRTDAYTFWSYFANSRAKNIGWRLDYFLVSERIKNKVCDVVIRSDVFGSDHCPIVLYANF